MDKCQYGQGHGTPDILEVVEGSVPLRRNTHVTSSFSRHFNNHVRSICKYVVNRDVNSQRLQLPETRYCRVLFLILDLVKPGKKPERRSTWLARIFVSMSSRLP